MTFIEQAAGKLYEIYCTSVGGKAFNGLPLPDWQTFRTDPTKKMQSDAWLDVAIAARASANSLKRGTKVSWLAEGATIRGTGVTISDEEDGHVLVSVDGGVFENIPIAYHMVIHCTVTWLTVEP